MEVSIKLPEDIKARIEDYNLILEGPKGSTSKLLKSPLAKVSIKGSEVVIESLKANRRGKCQVNTFKSHVNNLIEGVTKGYEAKLMIRYGHFPITVKVEGSKFIIENFGGEKVPRSARIMPETEVKVKGSEVQVTGLNKELVGQTAANIEIATRVKNKDRRIFQDGIWIVKKPGREGL